MLRLSARASQREVKYGAGLMSRCRSSVGSHYAAAWYAGVFAARNVATVIARVKTALATIGSAIFGISLGRASGTRGGVAVGRKEIASEMNAHLEAVNQSQLGTGVAGAAPDRPVDGDSLETARDPQCALSARLLRIMMS